MDDRAIEWAGKIAVLEHKVEQVSKELASIEAKLDELLTLRSKGMGAFWVASSILGTGIIGAIAMFVNWIKG